MPETAVSAAASTPVTFSRKDRSKGWEAVASMTQLRSSWLGESKQLGVSISVSSPVRPDFGGGQRGACQPDTRSAMGPPSCAQRTSVLAAMKHLGVAASASRQASEPQGLTAPVAGDLCTCASCPGSAWRRAAALGRRPLAHCTLAVPAARLVGAQRRAGLCQAGTACHSILRQAARFRQQPRLKPCQQTPQNPAHRTPARRDHAAGRAPAADPVQLCSRDLCPGADGSPASWAGQGSWQAGVLGSAAAGGCHARRHLCWAGEAGHHQARQGRCLAEPQRCASPAPGGPQAAAGQLCSACWGVHRHALIWHWPQPAGRQPGHRHARLPEVLLPAVQQEAEVRGRPCPAPWWCTVGQLRSCLAACSPAALHRHDKLVQSCTCADPSQSLVHHFHCCWVPQSRIRQLLSLDCNRTCFAHSISFLGMLIASPAFAASWRLTLAYKLGPTHLSWVCQDIYNLTVGYTAPVTQESLHSPATGPKKTMSGAASNEIEAARTSFGCKCGCKWSLSMDQLQNLTIEGVRRRAVQPWQQIWPEWAPRLAVHWTVFRECANAACMDFLCIVLSLGYLHAG